MEEIDEEFCRCVIEELRDGEHVTVETKNPRAMHNTLVRLGATDEEMERVTIQRV
jgi:hypothetical protein